MRALLLIAVLLAAGCTSATAPIREQDAAHQPAKPGWLLTSYGAIYVPPGTLERYTKEPLKLSDAAIIAHERVHAERQAKQGGALWNVSYALSPAFRWDEERLAYEAQLEVLIAGGWRPVKREWVDIVIDEAYRGMVSREDAEKWFDGFMRGRP